MSNNHCHICVCVCVFLMVSKSSPLPHAAGKDMTVVSSADAVAVVDADWHRLFTQPFLLFVLRSLASVIRGQVLTADGTPLIGVNVSFLHYSQYGYTITRQDGM